MDPRWIIPFAANLLLIAIAREANHYLAQVSVAIALGGLVLPVTALRLSQGPGLLAVVLTGFAMDATGPTAFGSSSIILAAALLAVRTLRHRLLREHFSTHLAVALLANLLLFFAQPLFSATAAAYAAPTLMRVVVDLLLSQIVLCVLACWFFALQERALVLWGVNLTEELRQDH
jgi:rod shape-determining protein MreD